MAARIRRVTVTPIAAGDAPDFELVPASEFEATTDSVLAAATDVFEGMDEIKAAEVVGLETGVVVTGVEVGVSEVVEVEVDVVLGLSVNSGVSVKRLFGSVAVSRGASVSLVG